MRSRTRNKVAIENMYVSVIFWVYPCYVYHSSFSSTLIATAHVTKLSRCHSILQQHSDRHAFEDFPIFPCERKAHILYYYIIHGSMLHTMALNTISTCNHMFSARRSYPVCSVMICDTESASLRELQSHPIRPQGQFSPAALLGEVEETKGTGKHIGISGRFWEIASPKNIEKSQAKRSQVQMQNKALYSSLEA